MTQQLSDHEFPNGGWAFRQPQTNWENPMKLVGFKASVDSIRKHRLANPAITAKHKLATDPDAIAAELRNYTRLRLGIPDPATPSFLQSNRLSEHVRAVAVEIKTAAKGSAVILDWLVSGADPVPQELAEKRAAICVACPQNQAGSWFVQAPAELMRASIKTWQSLKGSSFAFETSQGDKLKSCSACKCLLNLKVFVDSKHILSKTHPDVFNALDARCWILAERKSAQGLPKVAV